MYDTTSQSAKETLETIKNYVDSAIHYIQDRDYIDDLDQVHSIDNGLKTGGSDGQKEVEWSPKRHKHFAEKKANWKYIVKKTNEGGKTAKYKPGTDVQKLERPVWKNGIQGDNPQGWKIMKFKEIIGAK